MEHVPCRVPRVKPFARVSVSTPRLTAVTVERVERLVLQAKSAPTESVPPSVLPEQRAVRAFVLTSSSTPTTVVNVATSVRRVWSVSRALVRWFVLLARRIATVFVWTSVPTATTAVAAALHVRVAKRVRPVSVSAPQASRPVTANVSTFFPVTSTVVPVATSVTGVRSVSLGLAEHPC